MTEVEELRLLERMEQGLTTEQDAAFVRDLLRDLREVVAGCHRLAEEALAALERGEWQTARRNLARLEVIG